MEMNSSAVGLIASGSAVGLFSALGLLVADYSFWQAFLAYMVFGNLAAICFLVMLVLKS